MSIVFDAAADRVVRTTSPPNYDASYSLLLWFWFSTRPGTGVYATLFSLNRDNIFGPQDAIALIGMSGSDTRLNVYTDNETGTDFVETIGATNLATSTWHCVAYRRTANNSRIAYLGGLSTALAQQNNHTTSRSGRSAPTRMDIAGFGTGNTDPFGGQIAATLVCTADISLADLEVQRQYDTQMIFSSVYGYYRMTGAADVYDWSGNGRDLTAGGTLTTGAHPTLFVIPFRRGGMIQSAGSGVSLTAVPSVVVPGAQAPSLAVGVTVAAVAGIVLPLASVPAVSAGSGVTVTAAPSAVTPIASAPAVSAGVTVAAAPCAVMPISRAATRIPVGGDWALRFYGNTASNVDKFRIELDSPADPPVDVGASDFTYEFWMRAAYADNTSSSISDARYSNIILDRDIYGHERGWVLGVTRRTGPILAVCFGAADTGGGWATTYGTTDVGDDAWHHVALTWRQSTSTLECYVDGASQGTRTLSVTNLSYPNGERPGSGANNEYLVGGGEKHGVGVAFTGRLDELRVSNIRRYTGAFTRPAMAFAADASTVGLYHFDEGAGTILYDVSGVSGSENGEMLVGGSPSGPAWLASDAPFVGILAAGPAFVAPLTGAPSVAVGVTVTAVSGIVLPAASAPVASAGVGVAAAPAFTAPGANAPAVSAGVSIVAAPTFVPPGAATPATSAGVVVVGVAGLSLPVSAAPDVSAGVNLVAAPGLIIQMSGQAGANSGLIASAAPSAVFVLAAAPGIVVGVVIVAAPGVVSPLASEPQVSSSSAINLTAAPGFIAPAASAPSVTVGVVVVGTPGLVVVSVGAPGVVVGVTVAVAPGFVAPAVASPAVSAGVSLAGAPGVALVSAGAPGVDVVPPINLAALSGSVLPFAGAPSVAVGMVLDGRSGMAWALAGAPGVVGLIIVATATLKPHRRPTRLIPSDGRT